MKDEIRRIMQLVKDGKLSPDDAAELIEAFNDAPDDEDTEDISAEADQADPGDSSSAEPAEEDSAESASESEAKSNDPFAKFISSIEKLGKDVAENVDWKDISNQVRTGVNKGVEAIKQAANEAGKGKGPFGSVFGAHEHKRVELPLAVPAGKVFRIDARDGDITIEGGHDLGSVIIDAAFRAYNDEEAKAAKERYTPVLEENDEEVVLRQTEPPGAVCDIKVLIATGTSIKIKNAHGDISVKGTQASVRIDNASGDILVSEAGGVVSISTSRGDTKVTNSEVKSADVESKSGDLKLEHVHGPLSLKTSSGDIYAYECSGRTVAAEAASGDIVLDMVQPVTGTYNIRTVSGDIRLELPDGNDSRVNLSTLRGEVTCGFELEDGSNDRMKVTGKLGDGNGVIDMSAVNGNVTLNLRNSTVSE